PSGILPQKLESKIGLFRLDQSTRLNEQGGERLYKPIFTSDICAAQESDVSLDLAGLSSFLSRLADSFTTAGSAIALRTSAGR
ncbi:hypothetical protein, partial [Mesorhizobium sp. L2C067A000]|uniref:hypothetical protein n=1 Tax=Mesorhizobium sp. L2C067A000 TaxID=1287106 RepID=UPI0032AF6A35